MREKITVSLNLQKSLQQQVNELQSELAILKCSQSFGRTSATGKSSGFSCCWQFFACRFVFAVSLDTVVCLFCIRSFHSLE